SRRCRASRRCGCCGATWDCRARVAGPPTSPASRPSPGWSTGGRPPPSSAATCSAGWPRRSRPRPPRPARPSPPPPPLPRGGFTWRFGLANLHRRPLASSLQIAALGLGLMALLLLTLVRSDLLANWRSSLPPDAPNRFLINIQPEQAEPLAQLLKGRGTDA